MKETIIIPRRKIYEHLLVFESFLLELERYILYNSDMNFYKYVDSDNFELNFKYQVIQIVSLSNLFFSTKLFNSKNEFEKELAQEVKNFNKNKTFLSNVKNNDTNNLSKINEFLTFIENNDVWGKDLKVIKYIYEQGDLFHSNIISIIENR